MIRTFANKLQERVHGGPSLALRRRLQSLAGGLEKGAVSLRSRHRAEDRHNISASVARTHPYSPRARGRVRVKLYLERFIHAAIFAARPDVMAVVHAHAEDTLPFGIAQATKLRPAIHAGSFIGSEVPVWDIADRFGDTNLLVTNIEQARDLASCLGPHNVALMRGHGFASAARSLIEVVRMSVYLPRNARALMRAKQLGGKIKYLSDGEIAARNRGYSPYSVETWRTWEYWANKAGCGHLLTRPDDPPKT